MAADSARRVPSDLSSAVFRKISERWLSGDDSVIFAKCESDQPLGGWIRQVAHDVCTVLRGQDAQACDQTARRDEAGSQPGDPEVAREVLVAEAGRVDRERVRAELVQHARRDQTLELLHLRG